MVAHAQQDARTLGTSFEPHLRRPAVGRAGIALGVLEQIEQDTLKLDGVRPTPDLVAQAAVHGYTTAFYVAAGIFLAGALVCGLVLEPKAKTDAVKAAAPAGDPVFAH